MGELRTRKRGKTWEYSFEGAKIDGKRKPISKGGFRTKADALNAGIKAKAEYDSGGRVFTPSAISLSDYLDYWYKRYASKLTYKTQDTYKNHILCISSPTWAVTGFPAWNRMLFRNGWMRSFTHKKSLQDSPLQTFWEYCQEL